MPDRDEPLHLVPAARLQRFLGRELISDPNLAVAEFVKNAYDAGAPEVTIDFALAGRANLRKLIIDDNGWGMDLDRFRSNWMRPGYSEKRGKRSTRVRNSDHRRVP